MRAYARERLFWPGLGGEIKQVRDQCRECIENAPSQTAEPMLMTPPPDLPFQQVVGDFYHSGGNTYLIYADRYTGWTEVAKVTSTAFKNIEKSFLFWFKTFGVPEEISSDGGPPFRSMQYESMLKKWGIRSRVSSAHYPQSNGRAEAAVKAMKRALRSCASPRTGDIENDAAARAIMTHRNTPHQNTGMSPSEMLFGYKLRDHLPNKFRSIRQEWKDVQKAREMGDQKRGLEKKKRSLEELYVGDSVSVQNQTGNRPTKWSNTGVVVEVLPNRQYNVMLDGSRRVSLRNRRFLRRIPATCRTTPHMPINTHYPFRKRPVEPMQMNAYTPTQPTMAHPRTSVTPTNNDTHHTPPDIPVTPRNMNKPSYPAQSTEVDSLTTSPCPNILNATVSNSPVIQRVAHISPDTPQNPIMHDHPNPQNPVTHRNSVPQETFQAQPIETIPVCRPSRTRKKTKRLIEEC